MAHDILIVDDEPDIRELLDLTLTRIIVTHTHFDHMLASRPLQDATGAPFTDEDISAEISRMVYPEDTEWKGEVEVLYQTIDNLRRSIAGDVGSG